MSLLYSSNSAFSFFPHIPSDSARLVGALCVPLFDIHLFLQISSLCLDTFSFSSVLLKILPNFQSPSINSSLLWGLPHIYGEMNPSLACVCLALCISHSLLCVPTSQLGPKLLESRCFVNLGIHLPQCPASHLVHEDAWKWEKLKAGFDVNYKRNFSWN